MTRRVAPFFALLMITLAACGRVSEQYHAVVDRIDPSIPGLSATGTGALWGEVDITNRTGGDVYLYDTAGQEVYKLTEDEAFSKDEKGNWIHYCNCNSIAVRWPSIVYAGSIDHLPKGKYRGQVMKEWVIEGRTEDTPFKIYGRTLYDPPPWND